MKCIFLMDTFENIENKYQYLYILHSRDFDIDGEDTCYKFGFTENIARRKFDSCYQTAMKYPCFYKYWYEIETRFGIEIESGIKNKLSKYRFINDNEKTCGTEMFCCSLEILRKTVIDELNYMKINYTEFDKDEFEIPKGIASKENISCIDIHFIIKVCNNIKDNIKLTNQEIEWVINLVWVYDHNDSGIEETCILCNRKIAKKYFNLYNNYYDIKCHIGSTCIKKINNTFYIKKDVEEILERRNISKNIIKKSTSDIIKIINDASYYIYSYLLNDTNSEEVCNSSISDKKLLEHIDNKYDPKFTICAIIIDMHRNSNTYILNHKADEIIKKWNSTHKMYWNIDIVISYILDNKHEFLEYDKSNDIFILVKYKKLEREFINNWNLLDVKQELKIDVKKTQEEYIAIMSELVELVSNEEIKEYSVEQMKILNSIKENKVSILSGVAGSGKSSASSYICKILNKINFTVIQIAPTGKAVSVINEKNKEMGFVNISVSTIHSFLYGGMGYKFMKNSTNKVLFHIDEASMIDLKLFNDLLNEIIKISKNYEVKILICGDHEQLKPVSYGNIYKLLTDYDYKKDTGNGIKLINNNILKLDYNKRVAPGNEIFWAIRSHFITNTTKTTLKSFLSIQTQFKDKIKELNFKYITDLINKEYQVIASTNKTVDNVNYFYKYNKKKDNKVIDMNDVNVGDKIMIIKNGYDTEKKMLYYNGQELTVHKILRNDINIIIGFDYIEKDSLENKILKFTDKHIEEYHLNSLICYSWCKTIHKTQGDSFKNICIIIDTNINYNLLNTAITRTKFDIEIIYDKEYYDKIINDKEPSQNTFMKKIYRNKKLKLEKNKNQITEHLKDCLGKYNYKYKYMLEHNIPIKDFDYVFGKNGDQEDKIKFCTEYKKYFK